MKDDTCKSRNPTLLRTEKSLVLKPPALLVNNQAWLMEFVDTITEKLPEFEPYLASAVVEYGGTWRAPLTLANVNAVEAIWPKVNISTGLGAWLAEARASWALDVAVAERCNTGTDQINCNEGFRVAEQKLGGYEIHLFSTRTQFECWMKEGHKGKFVGIGSAHGRYRGYVQDHRGE